MAQSSQKVYANLAIKPPSTDMEYVRLGESGLKISRIVLGAMSYGSKDWAKWVLEEEDALPLLQHAYKVGINTWDTVSLQRTASTQYFQANHPSQANVYSDGRSEEIIAKALEIYKIPRENVVILTKCRFGTSVPGEPPLPLLSSYTNDGRMVNRAGLSRKHIFDAVQHSVRRLGTYIDVLQIHRIDPDVPYEEIMRALNDVVENGWVRYIGASSVSAGL